MGLAYKRADTLEYMRPLKIKWDHWLMKWLLKLNGAYLLTWYGTIYCAEHTMSESEFRHELEHHYQQERFLWFEFIAIYLFDYFKNLIEFGFDHDKCYRNIRFEKEAYLKQGMLLTPPERSVYVKLIAS